MELLSNLLKLNKYDPDRYLMTSFYDDGNIIFDKYDDDVYREYRQISSYVDTEVINVSCRYFVNRRGDVYNLYTNHLLTKSKSDGYIRMTVYGKDTPTTIAVNRSTPNMNTAKAVLWTWNGAPPIEMEDPTVDHINAVRYDNRIENLRWVTRQENSTFKGGKYNGSDIQVVSLVIKLYYIDHMSINNIADICGTTAQSIKRIINFTEVKSVFNTCTNTNEDEQIKFLYKYLDDIVDAYMNEDISLHKLCYTYGVSKLIMAKFFAEIGVSLKPEKDGRSEQSLFSIEDEKIIVSLYTKDKYSTGEIAKIFGVHDYNILTILNKHNVEKRSVSESRQLSSCVGYPSEFVEKCCNEYIRDETSTLTSVAKNNGVRPATVRRWLADRNIRIRPSGESQQKDLEELKDKICELHSQGKSGTEIGEIVNKSHKYVSRVLRERGLTGLSKSEAYFRTKDIKSGLVIPLSNFVFPQNVLFVPQYSVGISPYDQPSDTIADGNKTYDIIGYKNGGLTPFDI